MVTGPGDVKAGDIDLPSGVEILNPEAHIATLEKKTKLEIYLTVGHGRGYAPAEENKTADQPIGVIPIDSIFSPVKRVAYEVESARVGQRTDYDKLTLDVETDGSLDPHAAIREAAEILIKYLAIFSEPERVEALREPAPALRPTARASAPLPPVAAVAAAPTGWTTSSSRSWSWACGRTTASSGRACRPSATCVQKSESELNAIPNFGRKSIEEVKETLEARGLSLRGLELA